MEILDGFKKLRSDNIEIFPNIESVFERDLDKYREVLFPVCSIKLRGIKEEWGDEKIHLVQFNEDPYNTERVKYFNDYCKDNMIAFDLNNGKYKFKTDFEYFDLTEGWKKWFDKTKESYAKSKSDFVNNGNNFGIDKIQLGGKPGWWQTDETPLDFDGKPMEFITEFETDTICDDSCDKKIFLFYSPKYKMAVQLYQIT
ncbi:MAG: hypothetical protein MI974_22795 [Chitinophagales bacterium]|nr:hypothetical protein [Chitinophagales bacterium]